MRGLWTYLLAGLVVVIVIVVGILIISEGGI